MLAEFRMRRKSREKCLKYENRPKYSERKRKVRQKLWRSSLRRSKRNLEEIIFKVYIYFELDDVP